MVDFYCFLVATILNDYVSWLSSILSASLGFGEWAAGNSKCATFLFSKIKFKAQ
jgi:hypothetical protein